MSESPNEWIGKALDGEVERPNEDVAVVIIDNEPFHVYEGDKRLTWIELRVRKTAVEQAAANGSKRFRFVPVEETTRPPREWLHLWTAQAWAQRAVCQRLQVGCVITTEDLRQILAFGYNGPARGLPHTACMDEPGACGCIHAEANAVAAPRSAHHKNLVAFSTHNPCPNCAQLLIQAGVTKVYYSTPYRNRAGIELLESVGVIVTHTPI